MKLGSATIGAWRKTQAVLTVGTMTLASLQCTPPDRPADGDVTVRTAAISTPPTVTPPARAASAAVGSIPAGGSVGPDGHYHYTIPIEVPAGRMGLTPNLSLQYSSAGVDGTLGVGWGLGGLSAITRCQRTKAQDGSPERILFDNAADHYCLDGQRLVLVSGSNGAFGAVYKTEIDHGARVKIINADGIGPSQWQLDDGAGRTSIFGVYGGNAVTRQLFDDNGGVAQTQTVYLNWPKLSERDGFNNGITYTYDSLGGDDLNNGVDLPVQIDYGTCAGTQPGCPFNTFRRVNFSYDFRPAGDQFESWVNGVRITRGVRLTDIRSEIIATNGTRSRVTGYHINYQQSTVSGRSLVTSVQRCDAASVCMPATTFEWAGLGAGFGTYQTSSKSAANPTTFSTPLEATGNGPFIQDSTMAVLDANGDGNDDLIVKRWSRLDSNGAPNTGGDPNSNGNQDLLLLGDGGGYFQPPIVIDHDGDGVNRTSAPCGEMEIMDPGSAMPVDLDGNGTVELVARVNTGCPFTSTSVIGGVPFARLTPTTFPGPPPGTAYRWAVFGWNAAAGALREQHNDTIEKVPYNATVQFADVDGDGLRDLAWAPFPQSTSTQEWKVFRAQLTPQFVGPPLLSYATTGIATGLQEQAAIAREVTVSDFDGDGREDLISANGNLSTGAFGTQTMFRLGPNGEVQRSTRNVQVDPVTGRPAVTGYEFRLDINGDGLQDVLYRNLQDTNWKFRINTGNGYTAPTSPNSSSAVFQALLHAFPETQIQIPNLQKVDSGIRVGDFNGDHRDDLLLLAADNDPKVTTFGWSSFSSRSVRVLYSNGAGFNAPVAIADRGTSMGPMSVPNKRWPFQAVADVDGNGLADFVEFLQSGITNPSRVLTVHRLANLPAGTDVITRVQDELGVAADITMDALSGLSFARIGTGADFHVPSTHVADTGEACVYPAACTARGRAVRELRDYRTPRVTQMTYDYRGARVDRQGRGSVGFGTVGMVDAVSGRYTVQTFAQVATPFTGTAGSVLVYPDIATPRRTDVSYPAIDTSPDFPELAAISSGRSATVSTWVPTYRSQYPVLPQRTVATTDIFQSPSTRHSTFTTQTDFDPTYPLPTRVQTTFNDLISGTTARETVTTTYDVDTSRQILRRPLHVTATKETNEDARDAGCNTLPCVSSTVTYDYTYFTGTAAPVTLTRSHGNETLVHRWVRGPNGGLPGFERDEVGTTVHETQYAYDPSGAYVIGRRTPAGLESWALRDPTTGWIMAEVDPNGVKTVYTRDGFGRVTRVARDDGYAENLQYRAARVDGFPNTTGSWAINNDARGRRVRYRWTTFDNQVGDEQIQYAATGQPTMSSYGIAGATLTRRVAAAYDRDGRPVRSVNGQDDAPGSGDITTFTYDAALGVVTATDPRGDTKITTTDMRGLVKKIVWHSAQPQSGTSTLTTNYRYDETGGLAVVKGSGPTELMRHDALGRPTRWETVDPGTTVTPVRSAITYDAFGNRTNITQDGISVTLGYDADGRVTSRTAPASETQAFVWDIATNGKGHLASATGADGHQTRYSYDIRGRVEEVRNVFSTSESLSVGYTYDSVGRISVLRYPETLTTDVPGHTTTGGLQVRHIYGVNGQLARLEEVGPNTVLWQANTRHPLGMIKSATDAAGLVTTTNFEEGVLVRTDRTTKTAAGTTLASQIFGRDADLAPFAHQFTVNGATTSEFYAHNGYGQNTGYRREGALSPVDATIFYTPFSRDVGNFDGISVATASPAPDFPNTETYSRITNSERLTSWAQTSGPSETISYDNAGRIQTTTGAGGLANRTYTYNSFNLPTRVVNGTVTTDFVYDAFGARVKKRRDASNQVLYFGNLYEQRTVANPTTREAVFRLVTDEGVVGEVVKNWSTGAVTRRMFQNDRQGSPFVMTVGTTASLYGAFSPYGRRITAAPAQTMSNLGYTGHVMDDDLGLINMKGRVYDTRLRRFLTRDPILDAPFAAPGGHAAYAYVRGNPTGLTDPSGLEGFSDLVVTGYPPGRDPSALAAQAEALAQGQAQARAQMQQGSDAAATASAAAGNQVQADMQLQMASRGALDAHRSDGSGFMAGLQRAIATIGGGGDIALRPGPGPLPLMIPRESVDSFDKGQVVAAAPTIGVVLGFFTAEAGLLGVIGLGGTGAIGLAAGGDGIVATSAAEGAVISQEAQAIAGGHAFVKHVVERRDFPGIRTPAEFAQVIQEIMDNPQMVRFLDSGRDAYYRNGVVVITMPGYDGTAFPPKLTPGEVAAGFDFFMTKLH